jgi:hypothetical protein
MISLAMVVILILGINFVFRSATDAIGAGQNLNGINADAESSQPVLFNDLNNVSKNPPFFIITSQLVTQFKNEDDAKTGTDPTLLPLDNTGTNVEKIGNGTAPAFLSPAILGPRNYRADTLSFVAHGLYHRRTGNDGTYTGSESADDAVIQYAHAAQPANDLSNYYGPSNLPNNNNFSSMYGLPGVPRIGAYAADWVLARRVVLLKDPVTIPVGDFYYAASAAPAGITGPAFGANVTPLGYGAPDNNSNSALVTHYQQCRYDLAGITPEQLDKLINNAIVSFQTGNYAGNSLWWNALVYSFAVNLGPGQNIYPQSSPLYPPYQNPNPPYFTPFGFAIPPAGAPAPGPPGAGAFDPGLWYNRPQVNPTLQIPVTAASLAQLSSYFLQHCSQFVVEYAGDYLQQDNNPTSPTYGAMTGIGSDGQIDYYVDANGNKHIRWYGMPRSTTGVPHPDAPNSTNLVLIRGYDPTYTATNGDDPTVAGVLNYFTDVIPLRDYYSMFRNSGGASLSSSNPWLVGPPWEVDVNFDPTRDYGAYSMPCGAYKGTSTTGNVFNDYNNNTAHVPPRYVAAWHDDMPTLVRILIKVDDPNNKVKDGPWYEYVFRLK